LDQRRADPVLGRPRRGHQPGRAPAPVRPPRGLARPGVPGPAPAGAARAARRQLGGCGLGGGARPALATALADPVRRPLAGRPAAARGVGYFLLRRWWRVLRSSLRCFFLAMRLRRFLMTEPTGPR